MLKLAIKSLSNTSEFERLRGTKTSPLYAGYFRISSVRTVSEGMVLQPAVNESASSTAGESRSELIGESCTRFIYNKMYNDLLNSI